MSKKDSGLGKRMYNLFDLPADVSLNLPKLTALGREQIFIENHRGLIAFDTDEVLIGAADFQMSISGENLTILSADSESIRICGVIQKIGFEV